MPEFDWACRSARHHVAGCGGCFVPVAVGYHADRADWGWETRRPDPGHARVTYKQYAPPNTRSSTVPLLCAHCLSPCGAPDVNIEKGEAQSLPPEVSVSRARLLSGRRADAAGRERVLEQITRGIPSNHHPTGLVEVIGQDQPDLGSIHLLFLCSDYEARDGTSEVNISLLVNDTRSQKN